MFKVYMPHQNLGCLGVQVGEFYADVYLDKWSESWWWNRVRLYVNWFKRSKYTLGMWFVRKWR